MSREQHIEICVGNMRKLTDSANKRVDYIADSIQEIESIKELRELLEADKLDMPEKYEQLFGDFLKYAEDNYRQRIQRNKEILNTMNNKRQELWLELNEHVLLKELRDGNLKICRPDGSSVDTEFFTVGEAA